MSQTDFVNFFPIFFWFIILFLFLYYILFIFIIPEFVTTFNIRSFYYNYFFFNSFNLEFFYSFFNIFIKKYFIIRTILMSFFSFRIHLVFITNNFINFLS